MPGSQQTQDRYYTYPVEDLPPCPGPKLSIFPGHKSPIEWLERLDVIDGNISVDESIDIFKKAYVFKVKIELELYALKIFKPFDPDEERYYWKGLVKDEQEVIFHNDAFYAECRAYGRIQQEIDEGALKEDLAIPCLGYIFLTSADEAQLRALGINVDEDLLYDYTTPYIRGILKKLASPKSGLTTSNVRKMQKTVIELNRLQIYHRDIKEDNFRDGKLVDFSSSWTEPHCYLRKNNKLAATEVRAGDLSKFDEMLDQAGIVSEFRSAPNPRYKQMLRSFTRKKEKKEKKQKRKQKEWRRKRRRDRR